MAEPFLGFIYMGGFNFAPRNYAFCNGQLLQISQNTALFSLLGTTYGGDGRTTFGLPDLRGRAPMHFGSGPGLSNHSLGERAGVESVTLLTAEMPGHGHATTVRCASGNGTANTPAGNVWSKDLGTKSATYSTAAPDSAMRADAVELSGGGSGQAHSNVQPYLALNFYIALAGLFPSRN